MSSEELMRHFIRAFSEHVVRAFLDIVLAEAHVPHSNSLVYLSALIYDIPDSLPDPH